jgi:hypothetical protein
VPEPGRQKLFDVEVRRLRSIVRRCDLIDVIDVIASCEGLESGAGSVSSVVKRFSWEA